jgi:Concanavalin A-like lectin/glucanases superfamily
MKPQSLVFILSIVSLAAGQVPDSGLSAYYPFNGNANDSTGRALNDGKLFSASATPYVAGRWGQGLACNFTDNITGSCGYVVVPNKSAWNLPRDTAAISIWYDADACVKKSAAPQCVLDCHGHSNTGMRREVMLYLVDIPDTGGTYRAALSAQAIVSNDVDTQFVALPCTLSLSGWHNATITWVKPVFSFYVDGVPAGRVAPGLAGAKLSTNNKTTYFGTDLWTASQCFCGLLDDVRLFNRSVSDSEIVLLAAEGTPVLVRPSRRSVEGFSVSVRKVVGSAMFLISTSTPAVCVEIYNVNGRCLRHLAAPAPGASVFLWDAALQNGTSAAEGLYLVKASSPGGRVRTKAFVLTR